MLLPCMRWYLDRDARSLCEMEKQIFEEPWSQDEIANIVGDKYTTSTVYVYQEKIVGYLIYNFRSEFEILRLAVRPEYRKHGIGSSLLQYLVGRLPTSKNKSIRIDVDERNLEFLLFLKKREFLAEEILKRTPYDFYRMVHRYVPEIPGDIHANSHAAK